MLTRFLRAYVERRPRGLAYLVPAGTRIAASAGGFELLDVGSVTALGRHDGPERLVLATVRVRDRASRASYALRYRVRLVRRDRWYVAAINDLDAGENAMSLGTISDDFLAARAAGGDEAAFAELARRYRPLIGYDSVGPPAGIDVEDLRQAALLGLLRDVPVGTTRRKGRSARSPSATCAAGSTRRACRRATIKHRLLERRDAGRRRAGAVAGSARWRRRRDRSVAGGGAARRAA